MQEAYLPTMPENIPQLSEPELGDSLYRKYGSQLSCDLHGFVMCMLCIVCAVLCTFSI